MEWMPIETAPVDDGEFFLVYADGEVFMAQRSRNNYTGFAIAYDGQALDPTHWMPLPPPPEATT